MNGAKNKAAPITKPPKIGLKIDRFIFLVLIGFI